MSKKAKIIKLPCTAAMGMHDIVYDIKNCKGKDLKRLQEQLVDIIREPEVSLNLIHVSGIFVKTNKKREVIIDNIRYPMDIFDYQEISVIVCCYKAGRGVTNIPFKGKIK